MTITLTEGQEIALNAFTNFISDPIQRVFVLEGYSGTGKTTLIKVIMDRLNALIKTAKLINTKSPEWNIELTATTNKAAENFANITGMDVKTIHSLLKLRVHVDYKTGESNLYFKKGDRAFIENSIIFIDEASYIDKNLLNMIFEITKDYTNKIVFMGDPAQLTPIKSKGAPVFSSNFFGAKLDQVVRNDGPILELSTKFRETVNTGEFFSFTPDGNAIRYLGRDEFNKEIISEFTRPDWKFQDSKVLAWTNKCVIAYNHLISSHCKGTPEFSEGDYAICNTFIQLGNRSIKTDQLVCISRIINNVESLGVKGKTYIIDNGLSAFSPDSNDDKQARLKKARDNDDILDARHIMDNWIDLRAAYSCTINKAQGSTFDQVFIDLDDIRRCNNGDQIARMLYVAVSRARTRVTFTGDLV